MATDPRPALDPARMIAEARRAFFVMFAFLALIWLLQLANWADDNQLARDYAIVPRETDRLPDIFTAQFLHLNWQHIEANSGPLFVFGFLAAYRGVKKFLGLTVLIVLTGGAMIWFFERDHVYTVGASGLVYGYFGYVVLRGVFDRNLIDSLIGLVMGASFAYLLLNAVPGTPGVSWLGHLGGLLGGLAGAWIFRDRERDRGRRAAAAPPASQAAPTATATATATGTTTPATRADAPAQGAPSPRAALLKELDDLGL
ncbi:rhomboid family intramembrane serine protease [Kitasatospora sp. MBT63]|uniref:rhomboid family intramembrane serine protease n=1 Tax=Kitasatospora sp. MBT63 TaxID=1444768 RepID=UPI0005397856|nr:rhomboid family intramembrane serine protease [Kitasatospora sp. MBT63]